MQYPTTRQKKIFRIPHSEPGEFLLGYILLPFGYSYNADIAKAKKGDELRLFDGGKYAIYSVQRLKTNAPMADILCRMRYGITIKSAIMRWKMNAKMEGHGMNAISTEECLFLVYEPTEL